MTGTWTPPDVEVVSLKEAAVRLGISPDATRKRLERGTLQGEKRGGRRRAILGPDARADDDQDATVDACVDTGRTPSDATLDSLSTLVETLRSESAYLRATLDAEIEARRRADHLVAGLMERLPELAAITETPQERDPSPLRGDVGKAEPLKKPCADMLALVWRRWFRRITGGG